MNEECDIVIPIEIIREIADAEADYCRKVRKCDPFECAKNLTLGYKSVLGQLQNLLGKGKLQEKRILEIGCGNGFFLCYALKCGLDIVGIEPGKTYGFYDRYLRAIKLLELNGVQNPERYLFDASAESLPFDDNSFDMVFSLAVLEHTQNIDLAMREQIRVLNPDGILLANIPNYNSIYEGHYDIFWIPYMSKKCAKLYVEKFFKRDPYLINELNFTIPSMFKKYLNSDLTYGHLYLYGKGAGFISHVFRSYNFSLNKNYLPKFKEYEGLKKVIAIILHFRLFLRYLFFIFSKILEICGFATTFDIVLYKKQNK